MTALLEGPVWRAYYDLLASQARYYPARSLAIYMAPEAADQVRSVSWYGRSPYDPTIHPDPRLTGVEMRAEVRL